MPKKTTEYAQPGVPFLLTDENVAVATVTNRGNVIVTIIATVDATPPVVFDGIDLEPTKGLDSSKALQQYFPSLPSSMRLWAYVPSVSCGVGIEYA